MKLLIFDFDGTIGDTAGLIIKTMQQTMHAMQLPVLPPETCATTIGLPLAQCFTHILPISEEKASSAPPATGNSLSRTKINYRYAYFLMSRKRSAPFMSAVSC
jgi:phosphoglycolate phosphatase